MNDDKKEETVRVLSVDAWRSKHGGWEWNNWFKVGTLPREACDYSPRKLLGLLRKDGYLTPGSAGKLALEDDGYNVVIVAKGTREPLYALEYGSTV